MYSKNLTLSERVKEALNFEMFSYDNLEQDHGALRELLTEVKTKLESEEV